MMVIGGETGFHPARIGTRSDHIVMLRLERTLKLAARSGLARTHDRVRQVGECARLLYGCELACSHTRAGIVGQDKQVIPN
jgi:hypothetical protein